MRSPPVAVAAATTIVTTEESLSSSTTANTAIAKTAAMSTSKHTVLMVCDFFWPNLGGVEMHMWSLAQCLIRAGHKVVVLTHGWGDRKGVRYMTNGLKVYYVPWIPMFQNCTLPTFFPLLPLFRDVVVREGIEIVHGHQDSSALMHEALFHAQTLGLKTCFTSHSLFNIFDTASLHLNKTITFTLSSIDHCIGVSHTCRENMVVRAKIDTSQVSTIPNAVDASSFQPDPSLRDPSPRINIIVINRLAYRKGTDLVAQVIPLVCAQFPHVHFIIGGDGEKRLLLDEMRERYQLHDRVELLGSIPHAKVRSVLCRGSIFLNCSLTESFCMAILEAACCGLFVISTRVGGIPEVLPPEMITFAEHPSAKALSASIADAIITGKMNKMDPFSMHERVKTMYSWPDVAERVAIVYDKIKQRPTITLEMRLANCRKVGPFAGLVAMFLVLVDYALLLLVRAMRPNESIEEAPYLRLAK